jgi:hypothetical protein
VAASGVDGSVTGAGDGDGLAGASLVAWLGAWPGAELAAGLEVTDADAADGDAPPAHPAARNAINATGAGVRRTIDMRLPVAVLAREHRPVHGTPTGRPSATVPECNSCEPIVSSRRPGLASPGGGTDDGRGGRRRSFAGCVTGWRN